MKIKNGFERCRRLALLTQVEAAQAIGVTQCTICHWETGRYTPNGRTLIKVMKVYNCTADELFGDVDEDDPME